MNYTQEFLKTVITCSSIRIGVLLFLIGVAAGCGPQSNTNTESGDSNPRSQEEPWFQETTAEVGLTFQYRSGHKDRFLFPEIMGGGIGVLDYNNDGFMDIYCVQGGGAINEGTNQHLNQLFRNRGDGSFEEVTDSAQVGGRSYGMGCAIGDYDSDGDPDIYITNLGPNVLYRNNGDGTFTDVSVESGTADSAWGVSASFAHLNEDEYLDLVIANYVKWSVTDIITCQSRRGLPDYCSPMDYPEAYADTLFLNNGDGTFSDATESSGMAELSGNGLGVMCSDFDGDGLQDICIANDGMPNRLWINQGQGRFIDEALARGCAVNHLGMTEASMGIVCVDFDRNGFPDLFMTHLEGESNTLYLNENGYFEDSMDPNGPGFPSLPYTGFGAVMADFNHDRRLDLYVANGRVKLGKRILNSKDPYAEPDLLLEGLSQGGFREKLSVSGSLKERSRSGRGMAYADFDNDGDLDLVIINRDAPLYYLMNIAKKSGDWVILEMIDRNGSTAVGAKIVIKSDSGLLGKEVNPTGSYGSSNDPRLHVTLSSGSRIQEISVTWPDGKSEIINGLETGRIHRIQRKP